MPQARQTDSGRVRVTVVNSSFLRFAAGQTNKEVLTGGEKLHRHAKIACLVEANSKSFYPSISVLIWVHVHVCALVAGYAAHNTKRHCKKTLQKDTAKNSHPPIISLINSHNILSF